MRIAISCHPTQGGSGVVATELAMGLAGRGHEVFLVSDVRPFRLPETSAVQFEPVRVSDYPLFRHPPHDLCLANKLAELVDERGVELIHAHYAVPHAVSAILAARSVRPTPVRVAATLHGTDITLVGSQREFYRVCRWAMTECDGMTAVSRWLAERTAEVFDLPETHTPRVVPNFVDTARFTPDQHIGPPDGSQPVRLLHASNFRPVKRVFDVIRVFERVLRHRPAKLTMIGDGPQRGQAEELAAELNIADRVTFLDPQPGLEQLYRAHHLLLMLSDHESFGLAALEAMACGTPVIASDAGGLPEVVEDGVTGRLCPVGDVAATSERALELLTDPQRWRGFSETAARRADDRFGIGPVLDQYERVYERITRSRPG